MLESCRREQRAGRDEKAPSAGGAAGGDPPPCAPGQRPRQRQRQRQRQPQPGPDPLGAPPAARRGLCTARARQVSKGHPVPSAAPGHSAVPAGPGPLRDPAPAPERSAPRLGSTARAGRTVLLRLAALCSGPETPARALCPGPAHLGSRCSLPADEGSAAPGAPPRPFPSPRSRCGPVPAERSP